MRERSNEVWRDFAALCEGGKGWSLWEITKSVGECGVGLAVKRER